MHICAFDDVNPAKPCRHSGTGGDIWRCLRGAPGALRAYCGQLIKSIQIVLVQCARLMQGAAEQFNNIKLFI